MTTLTRKSLLQRVDLPAVELDVYEVEHSVLYLRVPLSFAVRLEDLADQLRTSLNSLCLSKLAGASPGCLVLPKMPRNQPRRAARLREELAEERRRAALARSQTKDQGPRTRSQSDEHRLAD